MSKRFTKFNSSYIMRSRHQKTNFGTIIERDWPTTNGLNVLRFGTGRRILYNSGNFVFTTSNIPTYHKKHKLTTETKTWNWDDCKDADGTVNDVKPSYVTNDIRDYAYYGSCVELIRATIEEIITDFPGCITRTNECMDIKDGFVKFTYAKSSDTVGYVIKNPFNIDIIHKTVTLGKYDNEFRFMSNSWKKYCVKNNDNTYENITGFSIGEWKGNKECPKEDEGKNVIDVTFTTEGGNYELKGYSISNKIIFVCENTNLLTIQPQKEYIDDYFFNLKGFKGQLLRIDTKPLYANKFKTPIEFDFAWYYPERYYCWPSNDYCIDIDSMTFSTFVNSLIDMAQKYDELWTDNIYRSMTHESIKNFDWTYSRDYYDGDEQDNIDGGERMVKILRVFGKVFDDVKFYIDSIKNMPNITYDKIKNGPEALLSDMLSLKGIDVVSTIGLDYDINTFITNDFLNENVTKEKSWFDLPSEHKIWYQNRNSEDIYPDICDNEMMRRFNISIKHILKTKGTQHSIDMILGLFGFGRNPFEQTEDDDYWITEEAFYTTKLIRYNECVNGKNEDENEEINGDDWTNNDEYKVSWRNVNSNLKGDVIAEVNFSKQNGLIDYNDPYSGIPLRTVLIGSKNEMFVVPYYDAYAIYDGNLSFQSKGGWAKFIDTNDIDPSDDCFDYQETLSYLHVVGTIGELSSINANELQKYDIYYVVNISNYTDFDENPPYDAENITPSHYFVIKNDNEPEKFSSWQNIVIKPTTVDGNVEMVEKEIFDKFFNDGNTEWYYESDDIENPSEEEIKGTYSYIFKHLKYLESIMSTNIGNNPHVGYGNYDDGNEFIEYMEKPFKYAIDKKLIGDFNYENIAQQVTFKDIRDNKVDDKIQIMCDTIQDDKKEEEQDEIVKHYNKKIIGDGDFEEVENDPTKVWFINTKVITIENKLKFEENKQDGDDESKDNKILFKKYFKNVILPYLLQVIPSTTILKLKGF